MGRNKDEVEDDNMHPSDRGPLNLILYGPPGTGKTYSVQREAVRILEPDSSGLPDEEIANSIAITDPGAHRVRHLSPLLLLRGVRRGLPIR